MVRRTRPGISDSQMRNGAAAHDASRRPPERPRRVILSFRLHAAGIGAARRRAELGLQRQNPCLQALVLLARDTRHVLDGLELLALDEVEVTQDLFGLGAPERIDFLLHALCRAGSVVHQATDLVEKGVGGLGHETTPVACGLRKCPLRRRMAIDAAAIKGPTAAPSTSCLVTRPFPCIRMTGSTNPRPTETAPETS